MAAKIVKTFKLESFDSDRLEEIAQQQGKKPGTIVRELVERYLDSQTVRSA